MTDAERLEAMAKALQGLLDLLRGYERHQTPIDLAAVRERTRAARAALENARTTP